jgi:hypothetical protein
MPDIRIDRRFHGPPDSGNGGYSAGLVAKALGGSDCVVSLWKPPPLGRALTLETSGDEVVLRDGEVEIATARKAEVMVGVPPPPAADAARMAERRFTGLCDHIFPACFVCGPDRATGDGLRIFPGRIDPGSPSVAALWTPASNLADEEGRVRSEFLWAALDCPGYFAVQAQAGLALLGRLAARIEARPPVGRPIIVTGWPIGSEGRRHRAGTALHDEGGRLIAAAEAVWVTLKPAAAH